MMNPTWLIKNQKGQIQGPFSEEEICKKINSHEMNGEELIAEHPSSHWKKISSHPPFYNALLKALPHKSITSDSLPPKNNTPFKQVKIQRKSSSRDSSVVEMGHVQSEFSKELKRKIMFPIFVAGMIALCFFVLFSDEKPSQKDGEITLTTPRFNQPSLPENEIIERIKRGIAFYFHDQSSSYIKAQNELVQAIEGDTKNKLAMSYLCLTYLELWPFSGKRSNSRKIISLIVNQVTSLDQGGIYSALCQSVQYLIKEQNEQAESFIQTSIDEFARNKNPDNISPFFYYLRSLVQNNQLKYNMALKSLEYVRTLTPEWIRPYMLMADISIKQNEPSKALKNYTSILKINPNHKGAAIKKGILEYRYLGKQNLAEVNIKQALRQSDLISPAYLAEAYFVLSHIALKKNEPKEALKYGKLSYSMDPSNVQLEEMMSKIGAEDQIKKTKVKSQQLIERGDQLTREGNLLESQSHYKMAFDVDHGKNSIAAKKLAQNLWKLGLVTEAIEWMKKSIIADPDHLESYILISDYYSQMYDFENASRILNTARKRASNSVDIFKGYALLNFRKNNIEESIIYSTKALELYEADVDSHILMSKSHALLGEFDQALRMASQAVEINSNNKDAQIQYAKSLGNIYGVDTAFDYFEKLISNSQKHSQNHIDYTMELAQFLFENQQYNQARSVVENLSDLPNKPIIYFLLLGQIDLAQDSISQAYEYFVAASSVNPSDPLPFLHLGQTLTRSKKYPEARDYFRKILQAYPRYPKIHYYIAQTLVLEKGTKNLELALKETQIETKINSQDPSAFQMLGSIYEKLGKYTLCAQSFQKAIELLPGESELYVQVAICYRKAGDLDLALRVLKSIAGTDNNASSNPKVFREMGALYELKKDFRNAANSYGMYLSLMPGAEDRKEIENRVKNFGQ